MDANLKNKLEFVDSLLKQIKYLVEMGDEDTAIRLVSELTVYLVSIDKKWVGG